MNSGIKLLSCTGFYSRLFWSEWILLAPYSLNEPKGLACVNVEVSHLKNWLWQTLNELYQNPLVPFILLTKGRGLKQLKILCTADYS